MLQTVDELGHNMSWIHLFLPISSNLLKSNQFLSKIHQFLKIQNEEAIETMVGFSSHVVYRCSQNVIKCSAMR